MSKLIFSGNLDLVHAKIFWGGRVQGGESSRLLLANRVLNQSITSLFPLPGQCSQPQLRTADETWPCLLALHLTHCQPTFPFRENCQDNQS